MTQQNTIDPKMLERIAEISRLKLSEAEAQAFQKDLNQILAYFSLINEIHEKGEELYYVRDAKTTARKDEPQECEQAAGIRSQFAKKKESGEMLAPKSL